ncbi:THAP domain-containing protein 11 [Podarcis muralis]|uniref:THAP domain-containing protein 11 n=2 Tax=Podarcis TaxID=42163 RepID=A0A670IKB5_PODMU|nr:THAP domain-containing protein 11 [Podarcis muralis]XP_053255698.1 THAP domain-containing protein 11 [Podarcis raffonei]CAI5782200.1 domain-containing 11 [Podarcis lilfordi]
MPGFTCCVPGCYNNSHRDKALHFYTFPKDAELRRLWLKNVSRAGVSGCFSTFQPTTGHRVCSEHFPGGRKSYLVRVPTIFPLRGVNERKGARGNRRARHAPAPPQAPAVAAAQAAVLLALQEGAAAAAAAGQGVPRGGGAGDDVKPMDLTVQVELGGPGTMLGAPGAMLGGPGAMIGGPVSLAFLTDNGPLVDSPPDHSYSLSSGTTSEELLRKLNEQRDIIALLEVKMKEMKGSIRRLRLSEAQLREEIREKDRLLHAASMGGVARKRHGL